MKSTITLSLLAITALSAQAATIISVDTTGYLTDIALPVTAGIEGTIVLDSAGFVGYTNFNASSITSGPTNITGGDTGGSVAIAASKIGAFTLDTVGDNRFAQSGGGNSDTIGIRGRSATGMDSGEGFNLDFLPGAIGDYQLAVHVGDFNTVVDWDFKADGSSIGNGSVSSAGSTYDEGVLVFNFTADSATENFDLEITRGAAGGNALLVGGASLVAVPEPSTALIAALGLLALARRRR